MFLSNFCELTYANLLSLIVDKCFFFILRTNKRIVTRLNFYFETASFKWLKSTTNQISTLKISKSIGVLLRFISNFDLNILKTNYHSLIYRYLHHCNINWSCTYQTHIKPLIILQKRAIRIISRESYLSHTNSLFYQKNILKCSDINTYLNALFKFENQNIFETYSNQNYSIRGQVLLSPRF